MTVSNMHDIIEQEVEEQVESLMADSYIGIVNVPFATCLVYSFSPRDFAFDIPKMRPHLANV